jgi:hypothetical protein
VVCVEGERLRDAAIVVQRSMVRGEGAMADGRNVSRYPCRVGWLELAQN